MKENYFLYLLIIILNYKQMMSLSQGIK